MSSYLKKVCMTKNLCLLIAVLALCVNANAQKRDRPNVIIIYMDDMAYGDIEPYGMTGVPT